MTDPGTALPSRATCRSMQARHAGVLFALGLCACDVEPAGRESAADGSQDVGKADDGAFPGAAADKPGALTWSQLQTPVVSFAGNPLFVSNNPEEFRSYGVLAAAQSGSAIGWGSRWPEAPAGTWDGAVGSSQCEEGYTNFGVYLAHIRTDVSNAAISLVLEAPNGATVTVGGDIHSTAHWQTTSKSWLSAQIAKAFLLGEAESTTHTLAPGVPTVVREQTALSLVEGRLQVNADSCVKAFVVASPPGRAKDFLEEAARGKVLWSGWSGPGTHGRAAGMFGHDEVQARVALKFQNLGTQGVGLLRAAESIEAIGRPSDSASILFGNYGALIDTDVKLVNETGGCTDVLVEMVSYPDNQNTSDRTPTQSFFNQTGWSKPPSIFWNGPVKTTIDGKESVGHAVLNAAPTQGERDNPTQAMQSMRETLGSVTMQDGDVSDVSVQFPVPGYIVAPLAITATARPCG